MLEINKELKTFGKNVVRRAKSNASKFSNTGDLKHSIDYELKVHKNSFSLSFYMVDYGIYKDEGVDGTKKKYNSRFSYRQKQPPHKEIEKWIRAKGMKGRDKKGRFIRNESLAFLIARSIKRDGIKPTHFFSDAFERAFLKLPDDIVEAYGLDVDEFLEQVLNN